jgi:hypothetical protein
LGAAGTVGDLGETSSQSRVDVAIYIGNIGRKRDTVETRSNDAIQEGWLVELAFVAQLALGQWVHTHANVASRARPHLVIEFRPHTACQDELPRCRVEIYYALDRTEYARNFLPFIQEDWPGSATKSRVGISLVGRSDARIIESDDLADVLGGGRGLTYSTGPGNHYRGKLAEQVGEVTIGHSGSVDGYAGHRSGPKMGGVSRKITQYMVPDSRRR